MLVLKNSRNLLHDRHKIFKIDLEIAEIIEVKVSTLTKKLYFYLCVIAKYEFLKVRFQL